MNSLGKRFAELSPLQVALAAQQLEPKLGIMAAEPVALIGMSCRFPGAANTDQFWKLLFEGREINGEVPADRWDIDAFYDPDPKASGKLYTRRAAFLDQIDMFDPHFFGISPREARSMDPQQRILLEVTWEALESANQPVSRLAGSTTGVFVGMCTYDFSYWLYDSTDPTEIDLYYSTGSAPSVTSGRLSYTLGLTGPCMTIDTACSSSLVAVHLACQSLRARECNVALAGGVNLLVTPITSIAFCRAGMLSRDGRCRTFDAAADGYGRGEGCGMLVLKRLADAVADNDDIIAVIRGSAVNQDGPSGGLTVPSGPAQQSVIRRALESSGVLPSQVGYLETHGTATRLGDPIEVNSITSILGADRIREENPLFIGSVKTNIGHLEAAAGVASLMKVALALRHGVIPAHLHFEEPNPFIDWRNTPCVVPQQNSPWPSARRIAGINSFGYSGTNAHVLLEAAPVSDAGVDPEATRPRSLLVLSAKTTEALTDLVRRYDAQLESQPETRLVDICHTAAVGRAHFNHRVAVEAGTISELRDKLSRLSPGDHRAAGNQAPGVGFLFTEQATGGGLGHELYETHPEFRVTTDNCAQLLDLDFGKTVLDRQDGTGAFALQYSLAELWRTWGVVPRGLWGQGVGEVVAACVSGRLSLQDGLYRVSRANTTVDSALVVTREAAMENMQREGCGAFLEIRLQAGESEWTQLLRSLAELYVSGLEIDWPGFDRHYTRRRVPLPTYPFQRQRYWPDQAQNRSRYEVQPNKASHPLLGERMQSAALAANQVLFESRLSPESAMLRDHRVFGQAIMPAAALLEIALAAGASVFETSSLLLEDVVIAQPLLFPERAVCQLQTLLEDNEFRIFSLDRSQTSTPEWRLHATGKIRPMERAEGSPWRTLDSGVEVPIEVLYNRFGELGIDYGPAFRGVTRVQRDQWQTSGRVHLPDEAQNDPAYCMHPALLDGCFQTIGALFEGRSTTYLPVGFERVRFYRRPAADTLDCRSRIEGDDLVLNGSMQICDVSGSLVAEIEGLTVRRADREAVLRKLNQMPRDWFYEIAWREKPIPETSRQRVRHFLILQAGQFGADLARALEQRGDRATVVSPSAARRLVQRPDTRVDGCIYVAGSADALTSCTEVLDVVQALADAGRGSLWLVTSGAQHVTPEPEVVNVQQAALWGLGNVVAAEGLGIATFRLDLDPGAEREEHIASVLRELDAQDGEDRVAYRMQSRRVARISRPMKTTDPDAPVRLRISNPGTFQNLHLARMERRKPGPRELEIEVRANGLNFRDVLHALGMLPESPNGDRTTFGFECSGVVVAVGSEVSDFSVGQEVIGLTLNGLGSYVTVPSAHVATKPSWLSFEEAAALPLVYLTAMYGLEKLARIRPGDRVLIHAAAGGVGQAALQIARRAGAEVFATAGRSKWQRLASQGVHHVMDSRTLEFVDEILRLTDGEGVDIVLNSLNGNFIECGLRALKSGGRFVELGKIGIWSEEQIHLARPDVSYFPFDLGEVAQREPTLIASMLRELAHAVEVGTLQPPPISTFALRDAAAAFRFMAQSKHYGKVVLSANRPASDPLVRPDATYLITGGQGALGMEVARWLVAEGARRLVLVSRGPHADARLDEFRAAGVEVITLAVDVSEPAGVSRALQAAHIESRPLRGIFHAAGVLDDCALVNGTRDRFQRVMAPKVDGALHLHSQTRRVPLDYFVCFSSASALLGTPGQGAYAAANACLDALAHHRRAQGMPCLSVNWGPWAGAGMSARMSESYRSRLITNGFLSIDPVQGVRALGDLMHGDSIQSAVMPVVWDRVLGRFPEGGEPLFYTEVASNGHRRAPRRDQSSIRDERVLVEVAQAPVESRRDLVSRFLEDDLRKVLGIDARIQMDPDEPLVQMGLDSLMGIELKSRVGTQLGIDIPLQSFVGATSLSRLTSLVLEQLALASLTSAADDASEEMEEIAL
jgi:acyl transferase domain-containing protein